MTDIEPMAMAKPGDYLAEQPYGFLLWERSIARDIVEKFSSVDVF